MKSDVANKTFCSNLLKESRAEAKKRGIKIPKLSTWRSDLGYNTYYEVWAGTQLLWSGNAYNASEAKSKAIDRYIEKMETSRHG